MGNGTLPTCLRTRRSAESEKKGGRKKASLAQPDLKEAVEAAIEKDLAGSPVVPDERWTNRSADDLAAEIRDQGFQVCGDTMRRILKEDLGLSRRRAVKDEAGSDFEFRNEQFEHIADLRKEYEERDWPIISIDTKKKEIIGNFGREGQAYTDTHVIVEDHDFVTSEQRLVPYGIYDLRGNEGFVLLSLGSDTSQLACDAVWRWWKRMGQERYWYASRMLVLCDCGGSNGYRLNVFKEELCNLASRMDCNLQIAHYPPGCSKYNPIEHRMFCHVTRAMRGAVLKSLDVAKWFISRTKTSTGLRVTVEIARKTYTKGLKASKEFLSKNPIQFSSFLPQLNYTAPYFYCLE